MGQARPQRTGETLDVPGGRDNAGGHKGIMSEPNKELVEAVEKALNSFRLQFTLDGDRGGLPLVDVLSPPPDATTTRGKEELTLLVDWLSAELSPLFEKLDKERRDALLYQINTTKDALTLAEERDGLRQRIAELEKERDYFRRFRPNPPHPDPLEKPFLNDPPDDNSAAMKEGK